MARQPTYSAKQIKEMCLTLTDINAIKILNELIAEEIDLYEQEDLEILVQASMIIFTRSLLMGSIKFLK